MSSHPKSHGSALEAHQNPTIRAGDGVTPPLRRWGQRGRWLSHADLAEGGRAQSQHTRNRKVSHGISVSSRPLRFLMQTHRQLDKTGAQTDTVRTRRGTQAGMGRGCRQAAHGLQGISLLRTPRHRQTPPHRSQHRQTPPTGPGTGRQTPPTRVGRNRKLCRLLERQTKLQSMANQKGNKMSFSDDKLKRRCDSKVW